MQSTVKLTIVALLLSASIVLAGSPNLPQGRVYVTASAPSNGVNETQLLTFSGTITGGSFVLRFNNFSTGPISWSSTTATLVSYIDVALKALPSVGANGVYTAAGVMASGIGTITVTFIGKNAHLDVPQMTNTNALTGAGANLVITTLTNGVTADGRNSNTGSIDIAQDTGLQFINVGSPPNPSWQPISYLPTPTPTATTTPTPTPNQS